MQKYCNLNLGWRFKEGFEEEYITGGKDEEGRLVHVPHTVNASFRMRPDQIRNHSISC